MADSSDNNTVYVTGFPAGYTEDQVKAIFAQYGAVSSVKVLPPHPDKPDVAAIVTMESQEKANWMIENVSGKIPQGLAGPVEIKLKKSRSWGGKGSWGKGGLPPWAIMQMMQWQYGKGKGKGRGGGLSSFPAEKKVWIGGLPEDGSITFKELQEHFEGCKYATVLKGKGAGTGGVCFATPEEATAAIQKLNGSSLKGHALVVDVWTKKEKEEGVAA